MLRKYQIDAIVSTIQTKLQEKYDSLKSTLRANFVPTKRQKECLEAMDELQEIAEKIERLKDKAVKVRETINEITEKEIGTTYYYYRDFNSETVKSNRNNFIDKIISKKLTRIPDYYEIANRVTVATISTGFDITAWIDNFVENVKLCEE